VLQRFDYFRLASDDVVVSCTLTAPAWIDLDLEFDILTFGQCVEDAGRERRMVEKDLAPVIHSHEAEASIANQPYYWPAYHGALPPRNARLRRARRGHAGCPLSIRRCVRQGAAAPTLYLSLYPSIPRVA
jgi:hypothetical protein